MKKTNSYLAGIKMILFFTVLTGLLYPLFITGFAQVLFPGKANGSLIRIDNKVIGSELIGQKFTDSAYFQGRPSATDYSTLPGGGSNLSPTSSDLKKKVDERRRDFIAFNNLDAKTDVPVEMLTASGSGLDPHISARSAMLQISRVAAFRKFNEEKSRELVKLVARCTEEPQFSLLGEARINVLLLNLELDKMSRK